MSHALQTGDTVENKTKFETTYKDSDSDSGRRELTYSYNPIEYRNTWKPRKKKEMVILKKCKYWKGL